MPAVTPAEVQTEPSRTKIGSDSTRTAGKQSDLHGGAEIVAVTAKGCLSEKCIVHRPSVPPPTGGTKHVGLVRRNAIKHVGVRDDTGRNLLSGVRAPDDNQELHGTTRKPSR